MWIINKFILIMEMNIDFNIKDLAAKCRSKYELYSVLITEGCVYLPPLQEATQKYLRDIITGSKLYISCKKVNVINVPHYKGLTVQDILLFAESNVNINDYLSEYEYDKAPNRVWLWNVINSLIPGEFKSFIEKKVKERKQGLIRSQNLWLSVKPEFLSLFKNSQSASLAKKKSHFFARLPKKTNDQKKIDDYEEEKKKSDNKARQLEDEIDQLHDKVKEMTELRALYDENADKLDKLYQLGIIDDNGNYINNDMR